MQVFALSSLPPRTARPPSAPFPLDDPRRWVAVMRKCRDDGEGAPAMRAAIGQPLLPLCATEKRLAVNSNLGRIADRPTAMLLIEVVMGDPGDIRGRRHREFRIPRR